MTTYSVLRDRALAQVDCVGQTEAQTIAQAALEEAMKFVAFHVRIPSLIASATATAPASPELETNAIAIEGGAGTFGVTSGVYQCPDRLYIKQSSSALSPGTPYEYYEYHHFLDLKTIPGGDRIGILEPGNIDERARFSWTITPTGKVWAQPLSASNVLTLYYRKSPAAYSTNVAPELLPLFDYILVNGAVVALKEFLREPADIVHYWELFEVHLRKDVDRYDLFLNSQRKRGSFRIHRSYRTR